MKKLFFLLLLVFLVGFFALRPLSASAHGISDKSVTQSAQVTCSGTHCDHLDPYTTGCAGPGASYGVVATANVVTIGEPKTVIGYVQLWYSSTCGTNWARAVSQNGALNIEVAVQRQSDGALDNFLCISCIVPWSNQLYSPVSKAQASANFDEAALGQTAWV